MQYVYIIRVHFNTHNRGSEGSGVKGCKYTTNH